MSITEAETIQVEHDTCMWNLCLNPNNLLALSIWYEGYRDCWFYYNELDKPCCLLGWKCWHSSSYQNTWKQKNIKCGNIRVCGYKDCVRPNDGRRGSYRVQLRKPERRRQFARPRHRLNVHIQMDLQKIVWRVWHWLNWSDSGYGQVADSC